MLREDDMRQGHTAMNEDRQWLEVKKLIAEN
jgi:hypothetical protein